MKKAFFERIFPDTNFCNQNVPKVKEFFIHGIYLSWSEDGFQDPQHLQHTVQVLLQKKEVMGHNFVIVERENMNKWLGAIMNSALRLP